MPSALKRFAEEHPRITTWIVLAIGMVIIFLWAARDVDLLWYQRLAMAASCVGLAGACAWIIGWE